MLEVLTGAVRCYVWCMMLLRSEGRFVIRYTTGVSERAPLRTIIPLSPLCRYFLPLEFALRSPQMPMLPGGSLSNHALALPSNVYWNIRHQTGICHSP
ncbi:hypothetical protein Tco_1573469 [Tanacetum coccineum]